MSEERDTAIEEPQNQPSPERAHETRRAITIAVVVIVVVFVGLLLFIRPGTPMERQGLALVLAIGTGGIAAFVGLYLTGQQLRTTRELEETRAREEERRETNRARGAALRACLEQVGRLVTDPKWDTHDSEDTEDTEDHAGSTLRELAQAEVLSVLGPLDGPRKRILVRFLYESKLINKENKMHLDLSGADLRQADLNASKLPKAALSGVRLGGANLSHADLSEADLSNADLDGADLSNTILSGATVTKEQLQAANTLKGATMPDGSKHP